MSVPQVMETDAGQAAMICQEPDPLLTKAMRPQGRPVGLCYHEVIIPEPPTDLEKLLSLRHPAGPELAHDGRRKRNRAGPAALGFLVADASFGLFGRLHDRKLCRIEVDAAPAKGRNLPSAHSAEDSHQDGDENAVPATARE